MSLGLGINSVHTRHATIFVGFSLAPSPKTATLPSVSALARLYVVTSVSDVTSPRSPSSLQCSEATEASSENNSSAGLSLPGPEHGGNTEKYAARPRELRLGQTLPPQHFVPNCY